MGVQGSTLFSPPLGLQPHEEVLYVQQSEYKDKGAKSGTVWLILMGSIFLAFSILDNILYISAIGILLILAGILIAYLYKTRKGVRYYLTNFRFVKTNSGKIVTELPRTLFRGKNFAQFLNVFRQPLNQGPVDMFMVQVLNPDTGNVAMNLGLLPDEVVKRLESINQEVYCQYCGRRNDPSASVCSNCGANL